jgi:ATP/maltotriose-dependent transcriptional regulator MalT
VAQLARDGPSNPEIATRLFISVRTVLFISVCTVQYHLSKVFANLGISWRGQLHWVLSSDLERISSR